MSEKSSSLGDPWLATRAVSKRFGGVQALRDVDLDIRPGEVHGLVGANGAGKSTFIRLLAGLVNPDSGTILLEGNEIAIPQSACRLRTGVLLHPPGTQPGAEIQRC